MDSTDFFPDLFPDGHHDHCDCDNGCDDCAPFDIVAAALRAYGLSLLEPGWAERLPSFEQILALAEAIPEEEIERIHALFDLSADDDAPERESNLQQLGQQLG